MNMGATTQVEGQAQNQYDIQRKQIRDDESRIRTDKKKAMERQLAGSGMTRGSGVLEAQTARQDQELGRQEQQRLSGVDYAQLQATDQERQAEEARKLEREKMSQQESQFQTTTGIGSEQFGQTLGFQREQLGTQTLLEREKMSQDARLERGRQTLQYSEMASREGVAAAERQLNWDISVQRHEEEVEERKQKYSLAHEQLREDAAQFGLRLGFDREEAMRSSKEHADQLIWEKEKYSEDSEWRKESYYNDQIFQEGMKKLENDLAEGRMTLQDAMDNANLAQKAKTDSLYTRGLNNETIDITKLSPIEVSAYNMGRAGWTKEEYDRSVDSRNALRDSMVVNAAEPDVVSRIAMIFQQFGVYS